MTINESTLMRLRIDYLENKTELHQEQYKSVILQLILEIERLKASETVYKARFDAGHCNHD